MTSNFSSADPAKVESSSQTPLDEHWPTFEEILQRLHAKGIYVHPHQLAEFLLMHGLPVDLRFVPEHLHSKAISINENYQGDMVRLVEVPDDQSWEFPWLN